MLLITCPVCTISADETAFSCGGVYGDEAQKTSYPRGVVREWWSCRSGCGSWFGLMRHTSNQRIYAIWRPGDEPIPDEAA